MFERIECGIVVFIALILMGWEKIHERKSVKEQKWNEKLKYIFKDMEVWNEINLFTYICYDNDLFIWLWWIF